MCVCVCVCDGWFLQVTNTRIVLMVQGNSGAGTDGAGRGKGLPASWGTSLGMTCLHGWARQVDRPTRWCILTVYLLYYRKVPSRMLFHTFFYFLTA